MAYDALPEVQQFGDIIQSIYKASCLTKMNGQLSVIGLFNSRGRALIDWPSTEHIRKAEVQLRHAIIPSLEAQNLKHTDQGLTSMGSSYSTVLHREARKGDRYWLNK